MFWEFSAPRDNRFGLPFRAHERDGAKTRRKKVVLEPFAPGIHRSRHGISLRVQPTIQLQKLRRGLERPSKVTRVARGLPNGNGYEYDRPKNKKVVRFRDA
jgi:hypothetical protein